MEFLLQSGKRPDIIHSHDWQTAVVVKYYCLHLSVIPFLSLVALVSGMPFRSLQACSSQKRLNKTLLVLIAS